MGMSVVVLPGFNGAGIIVACGGIADVPFRGSRFHLSRSVDTGSALMICQTDIQRLNVLSLSHLEGPVPNGEVWEQLENELAVLVSKVGGRRVALDPGIRWDTVGVGVIRRPVVVTPGDVAVSRLATTDRRIDRESHVVAGWKGQRKSRATSDYQIATVLTSWSRRLLHH